MLTIEEMLRNGVHIGHSVKQWNPKMKRYIFAKRKNSYILDVVQTFICLMKVCSFLKYSREKNKTCDFGYLRLLIKQYFKEIFCNFKFVLFKRKNSTFYILFVCTKKYLRNTVEKAAIDSNSNYINYKWLGGTLTNWATIRSCIIKFKKI